VRRTALGIVSSNRGLRAALTRLPLSHSLAQRYVVEPDLGRLCTIISSLAADGRSVTVNPLTRTSTDEDQAEGVVLQYTDLIERLHQDGVSRHAELSVRVGAVGLNIPDIGDKVSLQNFRRIARAARFAGTALTLEAEDHASTDATLELLRELRKDFSETGMALQACLRRTEDDARALAYEGSRVRLAKGGSDEPSMRAFTDRHEVDKSYVRCLKVLMAGAGYPMVATHDPRLIRIAGALATRFGRVQGSYEYQLHYGVRDSEQSTGPPT
jgi:proline dehydrogenase